MFITIVHVVYMWCVGFFLLLTVINIFEEPYRLFLELKELQLLYVVYCIQPGLF